MPDVAACNRELRNLQPIGLTLKLFDILAE